MKKVKKGTPPPKKAPGARKPRRKALRLKVGGTYVDGKGNKVQIIDFVRGDIWPYKGRRYPGSHVTGWNRKGLWLTDPESPLNLVREVPGAKRPRSAAKGSKKVSTTVASDNDRVRMGRRSK